MNKYVLILLICCSYTTLSIAESDTDSLKTSNLKTNSLKHNPFDRPKQHMDGLQNESNDSKIVPEFELRAVIVSTSMPMANVDGNILLIGKEFNGLKLIAVKEGQAKFDWKGTKIWLKIGMNQVNNLNEKNETSK